MPLALKIAGRYLFSRKSHSAINLISLVSVLGVAVTTMAIICTLSVYNGFQDVVFSLCSRLDPPVKVEPVKGKTLDTRAPEMVALEGWRDEVAAVVPVVEENALAVFGNHQIPVFLKGVGENYAQVHTRLDETLLDGEFMLNDTAGCYIALGAGVASRLETGPFFSRPIRIYSPRRNVRVNMANPSSSFRERETFASAVFAVNQQEYDESWVLAPLALVRELYDYTTEASALELRLHDGVDEAAFAARLQEYLGNGYRVSDRLQQQASAYNMMQIEKWITFLILLLSSLLPPSTSSARSRCSSSTSRPIYTPCTVWAPMTRSFRASSGLRGGSSLPSVPAAVCCWVSACAGCSRHSVSCAWAVCPARLWSMPIRCISCGAMPGWYCWRWWPSVLSLRGFRCGICGGDGCRAPTRSSLPIDRGFMGNNIEK